MNRNSMNNVERKAGTDCGTGRNLTWNLAEGVAAPAYLRAFASK